MENNKPQGQIGKAQPHHLRVFLATTPRTVAHESQEAALPAVALTQHTLHRLPLRVKANGKEACFQASPNPARPTSLALACPALTHAGLLCDPGQVTSPL